jgi:hypothetical protein
MEPRVAYTVHKSTSLAGSRTEEKSHSGIDVNERTDSEAKQSIREGRDSQKLLPVADLKAQWKKKGKEQSITVSV